MDNKRYVFLPEVVIIQLDEKFIGECKNCPNFKSYISNYDPINKVYINKQRIFDSVELNLVPISRWLSSELKVVYLRIKNFFKFIIVLIMIYFILKICFQLRQKLSLPSDKFIILIGSQKINDKLKDNFRILETLKNLDEKYQIVSFGKNPIDNKKIINFGFHKRKIN